MDSLLTTRDSLENIADIRKRVETQKAVVDGQLQAAAEAQSQLLVSGVSALEKIQSRVTRIRQTSSTMSSSCNMSQSAVENFSQIQHLHNVVKNFELTRIFVDNFQTMKEDLRQVNAMMEDDRGKYEMVDGHYFLWLLTIHHKLDKLQGVQQQAERFAQSSSEDVRQTIKRHFENLNKAVTRFEHSLFEITQDLLELSRGEPSLVVRFSKVVDFQERKELLAEKGVDSERVKGAHYVKRMMHGIESTTILKFDSFQEQFKTPEMILEKSGWIFKDLTIVKRHLVKLMPQRWDILGSYIRFYHQQVYNVLQGILEGDPSPAQILLLLEWVRAYYEKMSETFGVKKAQLEPPLVDGKEKELYDNFLQHLVNKLKEWYKTVVIQEKQPFILRSSPPDAQADSTLCLNTNTDMNQLVKQQLAAAEESGQSRIVFGCISACCDLLMQRQREWSELVGVEVAKEINGTVEEVPAGLFEYLVALANEQDRGQEFLDTLSQDWSERLVKKYRQPAIERFEEAGEGFLDVARKCIDGMIELIMNDLNKAFVELFTTKNWKQGVTIVQVCTTLNEYLDDASQMLLPDLFISLTTRMCRATVLQYLRRMGNAHGKVNPEQGRARVLADVQELHKIFTDPRFELNDEEVAQYFNVFGPFVDTLTSTVDELPIRFQNLREDYWDAPLDLFENMVAIRKDIDKRTLRETMSRVRVLAVQTQDRSGEHQNTFLHGFK